MTMLSLRQMVVLGAAFFCAIAWQALVIPTLAAQEETATTTAFLGDFSDLQQARNDDDMVVYRTAEGVLTPYTRFLIDPVLIYFGSETSGGGVDPSELTRLAEYLRDAAVGQLQEVDRFEVVDAPGPGVLRIRAAITNVDPAGSVVNIATRAAAAVTTPTGVGFLVPRVDLGSASIEVDMRDAETDERLVVVVATERGRRFLSGFRGVKPWGDVEAAFRSWAEQLRETLERIQAG